MNKYFGDFNSLDDVKREFREPNLDVTDDDILYAEYETGNWEGSAVVIFTKGDVLYEVHGSHCSCYGLEGQWSPELTSLAAIAMRPRERFQPGLLTALLADSPAH